MNKRNLLIAIAILVAWIVIQGITLSFFRDNPDRVATSDTVVVVTETIDTVYMELEVPVTDTLYYPKYVDRYIDLTDTIEVEVLVYADTVKLDDNFSVTYNAHVEGAIRSINFGLIGKYPIETRTVTEEKTITNTVYPDSWHAGVFATDQSVGLLVRRQLDRHSFSLGYGLNKTMYLSYSFRIK